MRMMKNRKIKIDVRKMMRLKKKRKTDADFKKGQWCWLDIKESEDDDENKGELLSLKKWENYAEWIKMERIIMKTRTKWWWLKLKGKWW